MKVNLNRGEGIEVTQPPVTTPRHVDDFIESYVKVVDIGEAPTHFHRWSAIMAIAEALGRHCYFSEGTINDPGTLWPNMYMIFTGDSRAGKSITQKQMVKGILEGSLFPDINKSHMVFNTTWEKLCDNLGVFYEKSGTSSAFIYWDEMSHVFNIREKTQTFIGGLTALWECPSSYKKETKSFGSDMIFDAYVNLMASSTSTWLGECLPDNAKDQGGFLTRTLIVQGAPKKGVKAAMKYTVDPADKRLQKLRQDIMTISRLTGKFTFDDKARKFYEKWYDDQIDNPPNDPMLRVFHISVIRTHVKKLSMIISASENNSKIITTAHIKRAIELMEGLYPGTSFVYRALSAKTREARLRIRLEAVLRDNEGEWVPAYTLHDEISSFVKSSQDFDQILGWVSDYSRGVETCIQELEETVSGKYRKGTKVRCLKYTASVQ